MSQLSIPKKILFYAITLLIFGLTIEFLCFAIIKINPFSAFEWQYYDSAFKGVKPPNGALGWTSAYGDQPRPSDQTPGKPCAAAFGDSFTHSDEVQHNEAWAHLASNSIGCDINNYGVGGYGTDQAYLRYLEIQPKTPIVIVGVYPEMLRRNLAASWLFYASRKEATLKPYFYLDGDELKQEPYPSDMSVDTVKAYHSKDRYYQMYREKIEFPYTLSTIKIVCNRLTKSQADSKSNVPQAILHACDSLNGPRFYDVMLPPQLVFNNTDATNLNSKILEKFRSSVIENQQHFVLVFFPSPEQAIQQLYPYQQYMDRYQLEHPKDCVIDTGPALFQWAKNTNDNLRATSGHFNVIGNRVIAKVVSEKLQTCGLLN